MNGFKPSRQDVNSTTFKSRTYMSDDYEAAVKRLGLFSLLLMIHDMGT